MYVTILCHWCLIINLLYFIIIIILKSDILYYIEAIAEYERLRTVALQLKPNTLGRFELHSYARAIIPFHFLRQDLLN